MDRRRSLTLISLTMLVVTALMAIIPASAFAGTEGKRNTALGLTAGAIIAAVSGKKLPAIAMGAGAAYAWKRTSDSRANDAYKQGYRDARWGRYGRSGYRTTNVRVVRTAYVAPGEHRGWSQGRHVGWSHSNYGRGAAGRYHCR